MNVFLTFSLIIIGSSCNARQLSQEDRIYYHNLKNCVPMIGEVFNIHGYVNERCRVSMSLKLNPTDDKQKAVFTYEYPKKELRQMVNDAINLSEDDFKSKWSPKEEQFCTSIRYNGKEVYAK